MQTARDETRQRFVSFGMRNAGPTIEKRAEIVSERMIRQNDVVLERAFDFKQAEAYFTLRQVLSEASTAVDGVLSRKGSGFYRYR